MIAVSDWFWERASPEPNTGCWLWMMQISDRGYGKIYRKETRYGNFQTLAHRFVYEQLVGPIPYGMTLDHRCNVPSCVNPEHLVPETLRDNILRSDSPTAINARKTHCKRGHPFAGDNIWMDPKRIGHRACRMCKNLRRRTAYKATARGLAQPIEG